ncbi:MAG: glutathione S-transferase N-terminal domain-containing protein, partial [Paracoccaceae bacterium]
MTYILHYAPDNASLIVRLALLELGLPFKTRLVERRTHAQRSPEYLKLNPNGRIPVLETPQATMFETGAILLWLADTHNALAPGINTPQRGTFL